MGNLNEADEAVKRYKPDELVNEFRDNLHRAIWKIVGPPINRVFRRLIEDSKRQRAEQWQPIADSRDYAERRARVNNELWMHADAPDEPEPESPGWLLALVIVSVLVLLMSLYVLSCGATPWGACWK